MAAGRRISFSSGKPGNGWLNSKGGGTYHIPGSGCNGVPTQEAPPPTSFSRAGVRWRRLLPPGDHHRSTMVLPQAHHYKTFSSWMWHPARRQGHDGEKLYGMLRINA